jgi:hypothetical protein
MEPGRMSLAVPGDRDFLGRLITTLATLSDPPIAVAESRQTVLTFESRTGEIMLRSRVIQALEEAVGPDWQRVVRPLG